MRKRRLAFASLTVLAAFMVRAQEADLINPDRPGLADSSATVRKGSWQIEVGLQRDDADGGHLTSTPLLLRYGLLENFELRVETDGYLHGEGANGIAPLAVGAKYRFAEQYGLIASISPPSGTSDFQSEETTGDLRLAADLAYGDKWAFNPNLGVGFDEDTTSFLAALTVQYNISPTLNVFADAGSSGESVLADGGVAWVIAPDTQLDASIGFGVHGDAPDRFVSIGYSRRF
jgi:hypothetical protein